MRQPSRRASLRRTAQVIGLNGMGSALLAVLLASCDGLPDHAHTSLTDPTKRHPIAVTTRRATLDIPLDAAGRPLAAGRPGVRRFVDGYREGGKGPLVVIMPRSNKSEAWQRTLALRLVREGIDLGRVRWQHDDATSNGNVIRLSYDRLSLVPPACEEWPEDVGRNSEKLPYPNYGCATQRNLALMVANPADLVEAAPPTLRGSDRRAVPRRIFVETPSVPAKLDPR